MSDEITEITEIRRRRGIYLLPNLLTTSSLLAGFYAIVAAMNGRFYYAAMAIFLSMIFDTLDGRVARLTQTQSAFGAEYDSLSDLVAFGIAPALVAYSWGMLVLGKLGWVAAFIYTAATALRLARFNTQIGKVDKQFFIGLPCPAAAGVIAGMVSLGFQVGVEGRQVSFFIAVVTIMLGAFMVSNIRYYSFKGIDFRGKVPFITVLAVLLVFAGIALDPPKVLFTVFFVYALSGPVWYLWKFYRRYRSGQITPKSG